MKKKVLLFIMSAMAISSFFGCSARKKETKQNTKTSTISTSNSQTNSKTTDAQNVMNDFSSYKKRINKLTEQINHVKISSNPSTNHHRFQSIKKQIDSIDDDLDFLDDQLEHDYKSKQLNFEQYQKREDSIEKLEDQLDLAEDALEHKFNIDD
ncbi:entericidin EcnA/B family protein [Anaerostipes sp. MSJ-23]|uniref:entericidin EcnA/B family protein n=1 Tax=unclassified Anaerostipes TaxID=2635253 RepID=UPI00209EA59C|nr:entericidin EcnA/B family protein [Anaerostipes sp. MSJ-23]